MTRKDYIAIAEAIRATQERIRNSLAETAKSNDAINVRMREQLRGVRRTAAHLADALQADNPRFDAALFLRKCGYGATTMNPRDPALDQRPLPEVDSRKAWREREEIERSRK